MSKILNKMPACLHSAVTCCLALALLPVVSCMSEEEVAQNVLDQIEQYEIHNRKNRFKNFDGSVLEPDRPDGEDLRFLET